MDHTILIRTRNRPDWVKKTLSNYSIYSYEGTIYLLDDSEKSQFEENQHSVSEFSKILKIRHEQGLGRKLPNRIDRVRVSTIDALKKINTKFFSFSSDDDFQFPEFALRAIEYLEINLEIDTVHGPEIKVYYNEKGLITSWQPKRWQDHLLNDPVDQLYDYIYRRSMAYYGVSRTTSLRYYFEFNDLFGRDLFSRESTGFGWYDEEVPFVAYSHVVGKIKYLSNTPMGVRGVHASADRIENFKYHNEFNEFTIGPIVSLIKKEAPFEIEQSVSDFYQLIMLIGTKYDEEIVRFAVHKFLWAMMTDNKTGIIHPETDYWTSYFGEGKFKDIPFKINRRIREKINVFRNKISIATKKNAREFIEICNKRAFAV